MNWGGTWNALFGAGTWGAGGNLVAWVICGVIGAVAGFLLRHWIGRHLGNWWGQHHPQRAALAEIREIAEAARRIAADTYEQHTGQRHPDAPEEDSR